MAAPQEVHGLHNKCKTLQKEVEIMVHAYKQKIILSFSGHSFKVYQMLQPVFYGNTSKGVQLNYLFQLIIELFPVLFNMA